MSFYNLLNLNKISLLVHSIYVRHTYMYIAEILPSNWRKEIPGFHFLYQTIQSKLFYKRSRGVITAKDLKKYVGKKRLRKRKKTKQVSSMIHSARPTVSIVSVNIVFAWIFVLLYFENSGRTDMCENNYHYYVTMGWPRGSILSIFLSSKTISSLISFFYSAALIQTRNWNSASDKIEEVKTVREWRCRKSTPPRP